MAEKSKWADFQVQPTVRLSELHGARGKHARSGTPEEPPEVPHAWAPNQYKSYFGSWSKAIRYLKKRFPDLTPKQIAGLTGRRYQMAYNILERAKLLDRQQSDD